MTVRQEERQDEACTCVTSELSKEAQGQEHSSVEACFREDGGEACLQEAQTQEDDKDKGCFEKVKTREDKSSEACLQETRGLKYRDVACR